jgi:hypothetical protein
MMSMEKKEAKTYLAEMGEVTLSAFGEKMGLEEEEAKKLIWKLVEEGYVEHTVGFLFRYVATKRAPEEEKTDESMLGEDADKDVLWGNNDKREGEEERVTWKAGSVDDAECVPTLTLDEAKAIAFGEDALDGRRRRRGETILRTPLEISSEDVKLHIDLARIKKSFACDRRFAWKGTEYELNIGATYPDDSQMRFRLYQDGEIFLSDCGRTYKFISSFFNLEKEQFCAWMERVMQDYSLEWKEVDDGRELVAKVRGEDSAFLSFLWLFTAVERIVNAPLDRFG